MDSKKFEAFIKRYWPFIVAIIILWLMLRQCRKDNKVCKAKSTPAAGADTTTQNPDPTHPSNLPQQLCQYDDDGKPIVCV